LKINKKYLNKNIKQRGKRGGEGRGERGGRDEGK
jgi:hypothetical protein